MADQIPPFACEEFPGCPDRTECSSEMSEPGDEEEGIGPQYSIVSMPVTGPCLNECHLKKANTPMSHSVTGIINGRFADLGS